MVVVEAAAPAMITGPNFRPNQVVLSFLTQNGVRYQVQFKDSLSDPAWQFLSTVVGNGGAMQVTDYNVNPLMRFYRVLAP